MSARSSTAASGDGRAAGGAPPVATGVVVIGTSLGGLTALQTILPALPPTYARAVIIVQHRSPDSGDALAEVLRPHCALPIRDADDKDPLRPAHVLIAPADYHLLVEPGVVALSTDPAVLFARPSIDVALVSAADAYRTHAVGVVLTGASGDGARGLARIKARGGRTVVQDPRDSVSGVMPRAALATVVPDRVLPLNEIGAYLAGL